MSQLEQEFRIKGLLAQRRDSRGRRMNITSLARAIDEAYGTVAGVVYGNRVNQPVRAKIAGFLGQPVEELFSTDRRLEACATDVIDEVSHG